jgi:hypothetical protein
MPPTDPDVVQAMTMWISQLKAEQAQIFAMRDRYAEDVTCGGRVTPLPAPYKTKYSVNPSGKSYWVRVENWDVRQQCRLEEGFEIDPALEGKIICTPF